MIVEIVDFAVVRFDFYETFTVGEHVLRRLLHARLVSLDLVPPVHVESRPVPSPSDVYDFLYPVPGGVIPVFLDDSTCCCIKGLEGPVSSHASRTFNP